MVNLPPQRFSPPMMGQARQTLQTTAKIVVCLVAMASLGCLSGGIRCLEVGFIPRTVSA